jgi:hypothetical protein
MVRLVALLKRRAGMSMEEFIEYYETQHLVLALPFIRDHAIEHCRRYLIPMPNPIGGSRVESPYDVITEVAFPDESRLAQAIRSLSSPEVSQLIAGDEKKLFNRRQCHAFRVDLRRTDLA